MTTEKNRDRGKESQLLEMMTVFFIDFFFAISRKIKVKFRKRPTWKLQTLIIFWAINVPHETFSIRCKQPTYYELFFTAVRKYLSVYVEGGNLDREGKKSVRTKLVWKNYTDTEMWKKLGNPSPTQIVYKIHHRTPDRIDVKQCTWIFINTSVYNTNRRIVQQVVGK